jgi:hypothetical protein
VKPTNAGSGAPASLPDTLDVSQLSEEEIAAYIVSLEQLKTSRHAQLPALLTGASDTKRDLEICKSQIRYCESTIRSCQSILRSIRP